MNLKLLVYVFVLYSVLRQCGVYCILQLRRKAGEAFEAAFGASLITIVFLIIALIITVSSFIESERKNDEYKDVISEYEENKEVEDADN